MAVALPGHLLGLCPAKDKRVSGIREKKNRPVDEPERGKNC